MHVLLHVIVDFHLLFPDVGLSNRNECPSIFVQLAAQLEQAKSAQQAQVSASTLF